jgi:hypothetical protein
MKSLCERPCSSLLWAARLRHWLRGTGALLFYIAPDLAAASGLLHHYGSLPPGNYPRVEGTYIYPAMLCNYLTIGMMLTLAAGKLGWIGNRSAAAIVAVHVVAAVSL